MHLNDPLDTHFRLTPIQKQALSRLRIKTVMDLLYHFPTRYGSTAKVSTIDTLSVGQDATLFGTLSKLKTKKSFRSHIPMAEGTLTDDTGSIPVRWFNQPYLAKMIGEDSVVRVDGKVSERNGILSLNNPKVEKATHIPTAVGNSLFGTSDDEHRLYPVYPESRGISSNWIFHTLKKIFSAGVLQELEDAIPTPVLDKYHLPTLKTALVWIHTPQNENDALSARKRFSFEEVFFIQLKKQQERSLLEHMDSFAITDNTYLNEYIQSLPFSLTVAQRDAIQAIMQDMKKGTPMSRLLEGDVGSVKTAVAAATAYQVAHTRPLGQNFGTLQVAYMAPTEVLAKQHFESFIEFFRHTPLSIALITGKECRKFPSKVNPNGWTTISKRQLLKWVENGEISVVVGTHALIQKTVQFKHLGYVIIDEQHRFGTEQRRKLVHKNEKVPHLLSMTATPIPRTLALTIYGDLDLSVMLEMPKGRKPIITEVVYPKDRDRMYTHIQKELDAGRQAYVICPRIDEPDPSKEMALLAKSVKEEAKRLKKSVFTRATIGILHSKMKPAEKEAVMLSFKNHDIDILCATSVVEVGVNVENATVILIEGAERFGLSQLHQLRGRVIRSNHQAYCYLFAEKHGDATQKRLKAITTAKNGFELAEYDLQFRGAGELSGRKQWGVSDIAMEALKNIKMVEAARFEAKNIVALDSSLEKHPALKKRLAEKLSNAVHFE